MIRNTVILITAVCPLLNLTRSKCLILRVFLVACEERQQLIRRGTSQVKRRQEKLFLRMAREWNDGESQRKDRQNREAFWNEPISPSIPPRRREMSGFHRGRRGCSSAGTGERPRPVPAAAAATPPSCALPGPGPEPPARRTQTMSAGKPTQAHRRRLGGRGAARSRHRTAPPGRGRASPAALTAAGAAAEAAPAARSRPPRGAHLVGELEHGHPPPRLPGTCSSRDRRCCGGGGSAWRRGGGRLAWSGPGSRGGRAAVHGRAATAACRRRLCSRRRPLPERSGARAARGSRRPRPAGQRGGRCRRTGRDPHGPAPHPGRGPGHLLHAGGTGSPSCPSGTRRCPSGRVPCPRRKAAARGHRAAFPAQGRALGARAGSLTGSSERTIPSPGRRRSRNLNLSLSSMCACKSVCQIPSNSHNCSTGVFWGFLTSFCSSYLAKNLVTTDSSSLILLNTLFQFSKPNILDSKYSLISRQTSPTVPASCCRGKWTSSTVPVELTRGKLQFHPQSWLSVRVEHQCTAKHARPGAGKEGRGKEEKKKKTWRGKFTFFLIPQNWQAESLKHVIWLKSLAQCTATGVTHMLQVMRIITFFPRTCNWIAKDWRFPLPLLQVTQRPGIFPQVRFCSKKLPYSATHPIWQWFMTFQPLITEWGDSK